MSPNVRAEEKFGRSYRSKMASRTSLVGVTDQNGLIVLGAYNYLKQAVSWAQGLNLKVRSRFDIR